MLLIFFFLRGPSRAVEGRRGPSGAIGGHQGAVGGHQGAVGGHTGPYRGRWGAVRGRRGPSGAVGGHLGPMAPSLLFTDRYCILYLAKFLVVFWPFAFVRSKNERPRQIAVRKRSQPFTTVRSRS
jgi:hypothetical protein